MAKVFATKPLIPWKPGGYGNPIAPQPDPADGPFVVDYADASGKAARVGDADFTDSTTDPTDIEIEWEKVYRWVPLKAIP